MRNRPLVLVPMPSRAASLRRRGDDIVLGLARRVAFAMRAESHVVRALPLLRHSRAVTDQSGLSLHQRQRNLRGAFEVAREIPDGSLIVIDDVITTGSSMSEAMRALGGAPVIGGACAAATSLRAGSMPRHGAA